MNVRHLIPMLVLGLSAAQAGERETFDFGWTFKYYGLGMPEDISHPIMADGFQEGHPARFAVDGDPNTRWCALNHNPGHFMRIAPDPTKAIQTLEILWERPAQKDVVLVLRNDEARAERMEFKTGGRTTKVDLGGKKLTAIEIKIAGTDKSNWASICEVTMYDAAHKKVGLNQPFAVDAPAQPGYEAVGYREVQLPHDWAIESPFLKEEPNETGKLPWNGYGWYRKNFNVPADFSPEKDRYYLDFDGVMSHPKVYVNGKLAGEWAYGYNAFRVDITPFLKAGEENLVAVVASNKALSTRWYCGAGIYRHVWLEKTTPAHIDYNGVYVTTPYISKESATVEVKTTLVNTGDKPATLTVQASLVRTKDSAAKPVTVLLAPGESKEVTQHILMACPQLWDCNTPHLYTVETRVLENGETIDLKETRFGVRTIEWKEDGFYLNGKRVQLNGVCEHHDLGALGAAFHERAYERKIEKLKAMGCNSIRMTHNPPAAEVLDLCDKHGILVIDELFDIWKYQKYDKVNGYHKMWPEWWRKDVRNFVMRDRNHPCVIVWSGGNEIAEIHTKDGAQICSELRDEFRKYDTTRPYTVGVNSEEAAFNGFGDAMDVFGFNYRPWVYHRHTEQRPGKPFYGSETCSCVATRDTYFFPLMPEWTVSGGSNGKGGTNAFRGSQVSSYGIFAPGWGNCPDIEFAAQESSGKVAGEYVWTGFDYIGEPTPYNQDKSNEANTDGMTKEQIEAMMAMLEKMGKTAPSRSSYFGIIDLAGFPKDNYYLYQSQWNPTLQQAHILPHWNWPGREGQVTPVMVYSAGDEAELFVNGKSQGIVKKGTGEYFCQRSLRIPKDSYRFAWENVTYEPGELKVIVKKNGKVWATATRVTAGDAAAVQAEVDRDAITGDGRDLSFIELATVDAKGNVTPTDCRAVEFSISGPAELVGFCNGNQIDHTCMQDPKQRFFNGRILAVVRGKRGQSGTATVTIKADGLPVQQQRINILPATAEQLKK